MKDTLWQQLRRFPQWYPHEWLGASLMVLGLTYITLGVLLLAR